MQTPCTVHSATAYLCNHFGCRLEPLAQPDTQVQRAPFIPLFKGGKRIHLAVQASSFSATGLCVDLCQLTSRTASASTWRCRQAIGSVEGLFVILFCQL